jgi:hypothetical protein
MLNPADVIKIKNNFVSKVIRFLKKRKYTSEVNLSELYKYYSEITLSTTLVDCLSYEDICKLSKAADSYPDLTEDIIITIPCEDSVDTTLSATGPVSCTNLIRISSDGTNNTAFPKVILQDNYEFINITSYLVLENNCGTPEIAEQVYGGCVLNSCGTDKLGTATFSGGVVSILNGSAAIANDSYFRTIRIYYVDQNGILVNTPIDLNLDPATSPFYSCAGCTTLVANDIKFGNANFANNFKALMDNVSTNLFTAGVPSSQHLLSTKNKLITDDRVLVTCTAKHNPSGFFFGINKNDLYFEVVNTVTNQSFTSTTPLNTSGASVFLNNLVNITTPCGDTISYQVKTTTATAGVSINFALTNFNEIVLNSDYSTTPLFMVNNSPQICNTYFLTASLDLTNILNVEWLDEEDTILSETTTAVVYSPGTYTFKAYTTVGCVIIRTITIN